MSNLNQVQGLIAAGDKDSALAVLASMLVKDPKQLEAWLMLGDLVDDPSHRKDCYRWALRLSPENAHALAKLRELEEPPAGDLQAADSKVGDTDKKSPVEEEKPTLKNIPKPIVTSAASRSKGLGIIAYVLRAWRISSAPVCDRQSGRIFEWRQRFICRSDFYRPDCSDNYALGEQ